MFVLKLSTTGISNYILIPLGAPCNHGRTYSHHTYPVRYGWWCRWNYGFWTWNLMMMFSGFLWECEREGQGLEAREEASRCSRVSNAAEVLIIYLLFLSQKYSTLSSIRTVADNLRTTKNTSEMFDSATVCFTEIDGWRSWLLPRQILRYWC